MTSVPPPDAPTGPLSAAASDSPVPATVLVAAALAALEAVAVLAYAVVYTVEVLPLGPDALTRALIAGGVVVFLLMVAAGLGAAARALLQLRHWPRSLLVVVQIIVAAIMGPLALDGMLVAWPAVIVAVGLTGLVLAPATIAATER